MVDHPPEETAMALTPLQHPEVVTDLGGKDTIVAMKMTVVQAGTEEEEGDTTVVEAMSQVVKEDKDHLLTLSLVRMAAGTTST